jgi:predicted RNA-binding protein with PIN domain
MALLIDGYNLLHASGIVGRGSGPGGLARSRQALLEFLAAVLPEVELHRTTVVFDAKDARKRLPKVEKHRGMTVRYSAGYEEADALIEELIQADSAPRSLVVVTSDHRIQQAARRRRAKPIDSSQWYARVCREHGEKRRQKPAVMSKPLRPSDKEVEYWVSVFNQGEKSEGDGRKARGEERGAKRKGTIRG